MTAKIIFKLTLLTRRGSIHPSNLQADHGSGFDTIGKAKGS